MDAVAIGALLGPAQVAARVVEMAGQGRHHPIWSLLFACGSVAAGLILLALNLQLPALAMILYGEVMAFSRLHVGRCTWPYSTRSASQP